MTAASPTTDADTVSVDIVYGDHVAIDGVRAIQPRHGPGATRPRSRAATRSGGAFG